MTELARANGIRVVLASVTPVCDCFKEQTAVRPQGKIIGLNGWITGLRGQERRGLSELLRRAGGGAEFPHGADA